MRCTTHYYVLSLGSESSMLYEAFRDALICVENQGFPVLPTVPTPADDVEDSERSHRLMRTVDECFDFYDTRERLGIVVVGDEALQSAFDAVTTHGAAVVGRVYGDRTATRAVDLGPMVWPVVKEVLSAAHDRAMHDIERCARTGRVASGLDVVVVALSEGAQGTLMVEDNLRVRGGIDLAAQPPAVSDDVDVRDTHDDAVDAVIERVLGDGGSVVFLRPGALADRGRIALLIPQARKP